MMTSVEMIQAFFREIPVLGWWAVTPVVLAYGVFFFDLLSLAVVGLRQRLTGVSFVDKRQKCRFNAFVGGTAVAQGLIYIFTGSIYVCCFTLQDFGYALVYCLTLLLIPIAATYFFASLIAFIASRFRSRSV